MSGRTGTIAILVPVVVCAALLIPFAGFVPDDLYIYLQFARNAVHLFGFEREAVRSRHTPGEKRAPWGRGVTWGSPEFVLQRTLQLPRRHVQSLAAKRALRPRCSAKLFNLLRSGEAAFVASFGYCALLGAGREAKGGDYGGNEKGRARHEEYLCGIRPGRQRSV